MGIQERDWYQRDQRAKEYKAAGVKYKNSQGWYYRLNGYDFGPCDKDNICRLMREHRLDDSSLVKHGSGEWMQISKLRKEFPKGGYIYKTGKKSSASVHVGEEHKSSVSTVGIVLGVITFLICLWQKIDIRVMVFSIALSVVMPSTIRIERAKRRITLLGVMATIVLIINFIFLGLILFLRYFA